MKQLHFISGTLQVEARGYWFSGGGEKGSFGYYPHLRNQIGLPVYPDTQVHGDLKMAARWLAKLGFCSLDLVTQVFGSESQSGCPGQPSRVFLNDLTPTSATAKDRFEVKPRISICDETRTVENHFLVDLEMARLDGLTLEASLHIGPFDSLDQLRAAQKLVRESAVLLSGFGAFRSRGYGRGELSLAWGKPQQYAPKGVVLPTAPTQLAFIAHGNMRNKPIDPGSSQIIATDLALTAEQVKGWLARTYKAICGLWPTPLQMAGIGLSPFYPTPDSATLTMPPPVTTLENARGMIKNVSLKNTKEPDTENFFSTKTKPLGPQRFVTAEGKVFNQPIERRFRNNTSETFATTPTGLFVQEFLPAGTIFSGTVSFSDSDPAFATQAWEILSTLPAVIKGCWLVPECVIPGTANPVAATPLLLRQPLPFDPCMCNTENRLTIATQRSYNTTRNRPRRPRPVVLPGSVVTSAEHFDATVLPWAGFALEEALDVLQPPSCPERPKPQPAPLFILPPGIDLNKIGGAQAGQLREMLHPAIFEATLRRILDHRLVKYEAKGGEKNQYLKAVLTVIQGELTKGRPQMDDFIRQLLEELAQKWWDNREKGQSTDRGEGPLS